MSDSIYIPDDEFVKLRSYAWSLARRSLKSGIMDCVYFVAPVEGGPIKIGTTGDPNKRFNTIQSCSPLPLHFVAIAPGGRDLESTYHTLFARERLHGEWFELSERLMDEVSSLVRRWVG
jgi:hypothetical protein